MTGVPSRFRVPPDPARGQNNGNTAVHSMELVLLSSALVVYLTGISLSVLGTVRRSDRLHRLSILVLGLAWLVHLGALVRRGLVAGHFPLSNSAEFLLALAWMVLTLHLVIWVRWRVNAAGVVLPPLAAIMVAAGVALLPGAGRSSVHAARGLFVLHTTASTLGLAALGAAFAMSVMYLLQERALKSKRSFRILERLPSLDACDRIGHKAVVWGLPLLTLGIITGVLWNFIENHRFFSGRAKESFPVIAWALFALLLYARRAWGYRGRKSAYLTIAGFVFGLLTILGIAR